MQVDSLPTELSGKPSLQRIFPAQESNPDLSHCRRILYQLNHKGSPSCGSAGRESARDAGDLGLIPGLGRSPGEGKGHPLQCSCLENSMDCIVHGVAKSRAQLSTFQLFDFTTRTRVHTGKHTHTRTYTRTRALFPILIFHGLGIEQGVTPLGCYGCVLR